MLHVLPERIHEKQCMRHPRALQGHKIVAGGNAPGKRHPHSPTPKGSNSRGPQDARPAWRHPDSTLAGSDVMGGASSGGVAPGYSIDPLRGSSMDSAGDFRGAKKQMERLLVRGWRRHCLLCRRPLRSW